MTFEKFCELPMTDFENLLQKHREPTRENIAALCAVVSDAFDVKQLDVAEGLEIATRIHAQTVRYMEVALGKYRAIDDAVREVTCQPHGITYTCASDESSPQVSVERGARYIEQTQKTRKAEEAARIEAMCARIVDQFEERLESLVKGAYDPEYFNFLRFLEEKYPNTKYTTQMGAELTRRNYVVKDTRCFGSSAGGVFVCWSTDLAVLSRLGTA